jgi:hypothetical protein
MIPNKIFAGILILGLMASCSLFTETDLSKSHIDLYAPANEITTYTRTQTFWWSTVQDADGYNLQIVSPRFDYVSNLIADTNVSSNQFTVTLAPGKYEWAVSAYNSTSWVSSSTFSLTVNIDSSNNLANQIVILSSPISNPNLNNPLVNFKWEILQGATQYQIQVKKDDWGTGTTVKLESSADNSINLLLTEGIFFWGVRASNDQSMTQYSTSQLIIDLTAPSAPTITIPAKNNDTINVAPYSIEWMDSDPTPLSAVSDSIFVASDSLFSDPVIYISSTLEQSISDLDNKKYFVKVKSFDAAGNVGPYSSTRKFILHKQ